MKAERLSLDIINTLPKDIIENILYRLPFKDAVRTSILSRNWRYNWPTIPKLEFIKDDFEGDGDFMITTDEAKLLDLEWASDSPSERRKQISKRCKLFNAIDQVLLVHRGPIHEFTLSMDADCCCHQIDAIILHLSNNYSVKKFTLKLEPWKEYDVPNSIFSLHQLTDLYLSNCMFSFNPKIFNGFGSLTSLYLEHVYTYSDELLRFISNSPLLKSLTLNMIDVDFNDMDDLSIYELFKCLLVIEHLTISLWVIMDFVHDAVPRELSTSLVHLISFCLKDMCFVDNWGLPVLLMMMRCSPKLEKIKLQIDRISNHSKRVTNSLLKDVSDISLEHLKELEIEDFTNLKTEMEFVKFILAKSPVLQKVSIYHNVSKDEELKMVKSLLRGPNISPAVDIFVEHCRGKNRG